MSAPQVKMFPLLDLHQLLMLFAETLTYSEPGTVFSSIIFYNMQLLLLLLLLLFVLFINVYIYFLLLLVLMKLLLLLLLFLLLLLCFCIFCMYVFFFSTRAFFVIGLWAVKFACK
jgi:hypothetical protein